MGLKYIKQKNDKFSVFDTCSDTLIIVDATQEELVDALTRRARARIEYDLKRDLEWLANGKMKPPGWDLTVSEAVRLHKSHTEDVEFEAAVDELKALHSRKKK